MIASKIHRRIPLKAKLSASFVLVTLVGGIIAGVLVDHNVAKTTRAAFEDRLSYETTMLGQMTANALFGDLDPTDTSLSGPVHTLSEAVHTQLAVIAKNGAVVADSTVDDPRQLASQADMPEIATAREKGSGTAVHEGRLYVAHAIVRDGVTLGYARSSVAMSDVEQRVRAVRVRIAGGSALALLVAVVLGLFISSRIVRPVSKLTEGARRVGAGDFTQAIDIPAGDEIGDLATCFNEMTKNLRHTMNVLDGRNNDMRLVLDNVDQGLLTIDREGAISKERSLAVDRWLGNVEGAARFGEMLSRFDPKAGSHFNDMWEEVIDGMMPLAINVAQLPKLATRGEQQLEISYTPILDGDEELTKMLIVISDVTAARAAQRAEAEQREVASIFEHMMRDKAGVLEFLLDMEMQVRILSGAVRAPLVEIKRRLHTAKGNAAIYGLQRFSGLCHTIETRMAESDTDLTVEDRTLLADTWKYMSERLSAFVSDTKQVVIEDDEYAALLTALFDGAPRGAVAVMIRDWRMERASDRLARFAASARDLARRLDKGDLEIVIDRTLLRLPRETWAPLWSSFTHVVRNAVDHGLESKEERAKAGKNTPPCLRFSATRHDGEVVVQLSDDGRGIDWARVAERAQKIGLPAANHEDLVAALFADGVSTRDEVTQTSGRGVGLAAVKDACTKMGGWIEVKSELGKGTTFSFHIPSKERGVSIPPSPDTMRANNTRKAV